MCTAFGICPSRYLNLDRVSMMTSLFDGIDFKFSESIVKVCPTLMEGRTKTIKANKNNKDILFCFILIFLDKMLFALVISGFILPIVGNIIVVSW